VLKGISYTFQPGSFTAIMGKNGSGKTTLIRCINKELKGYRGIIKIDTAPLTSYNLEALAYEMAFVPQGHQTVFGSTVFETILLGRLPFMTWAPSDNDYRIVDQVINQLNLTQLSTKDIHRISGGERQKVYIARAIAQDTPIIILDEPIVYLDLKHQLEIMTILKNLALQGKNIIMVVHDINLAIQFCNSLILMKDGMFVHTLEKDDLTELMIEEVFEISMQKLQKNQTTYFTPVL
jgi:iron complex transport system ATP-binding protein